jgi:hypothetical protein
MSKHSARRNGLQRQEGFRDIHTMDIERRTLRDVYLRNNNDEMLVNKSLMHVRVDHDGNEIPLYSVPYPNVGRSEDVPDYHMLTPAYCLKFSGMSTPEHITSLFIPSSQNNIINRGVRWLKEDKQVVYTSIFNKAAAIASGIVLLTTLLIVWLSFSIQAQEEFMIDETTKEWISLSEEQKKKRKSKLHTLNSFTSNYWKYARLGLSGLASAAFAFEVYKRTTIPKDKTVITNVYRGQILKDSSKVFSDF